MDVERTKKAKKPDRRHLVQDTAARLRDLIFAQEPDTIIGSLPTLAAQLGVGIVTVQQAARVLEHEGLLDVRRGPGGGYYGVRPDEAALERSIAAYIRHRSSSYRETLDIITLVNCEFIAAAAKSEDEAARTELKRLAALIETRDAEHERVTFEHELQQLLFRMVDRPLLELLVRVAFQLYPEGTEPYFFPGEEGAAEWKSGRQRIIAAILGRDEELARFEAQRYRTYMLGRLSE